MLAIGRSRQLDHSLSEHAIAVCTYALILGQALHYGFMRLHNLATGALLHDIGLLQLPEHIRLQPSGLSEYERVLYESHPRLGAISLEQQGFDQDVRRMVAEHHIAPDNSGYPRESSEHATIKESQIVQVADRYHEFITGAADAAPISHLALSRLYQEAKENCLDRTLVSLFIKMLGVYPVYSLVQMNTGEPGIVMGFPSGKLLRPEVLLIQDGYGTPYAPPIRIDLASPEAQSCLIENVPDVEKEGLRIEDFLQE